MFNKLHALALANTLALIDLVLHPLFHIWGWVSPRSYELVMSEFVIGLHLQVDEQFTPKFLIFWLVEASVVWAFGYVVAKIYNRLSKTSLS